ncbi:MAG: carboxylating nicotinate-nucleotide diphosphorylase [Flavisolibacter sp.]
MIEDKAKLYHLIEEALSEDLGQGDHSTLCCIPAGVKGKAILKIKQDGIMAGMQVAESIFTLKDPKARFTAFHRDGVAMEAGQNAFEVETYVYAILKYERLVLNCMQRMCGIATLTKKYVEKLKGFKTQVLDTRKTTPNFRLLEKEAVKIGGAVNHRMGLYDMIMLKDNHIDYCGSIEKAIERAIAYTQLYAPDLKIEVETRSIEEVKKVIKVGKVKIQRIMLDNFLPSEIREAVQITTGNFETEASGGITLENIEEYATTGVDFISVGAIIHQAKSIDLSLKATIK